MKKIFLFFSLIVVATCASGSKPLAPKKIVVARVVIDYKLTDNTKIYINARLIDKPIGRIETWKYGKLVYGDTYVIKADFENKEIKKLLATPGVRLSIKKRQLYLNHSLPNLDEDKDADSLQTALDSCWEKAKNVHVKEKTTWIYYKDGSAQLINKAVIKVTKELDDNDPMVTTPDNFTPESDSSYSD